MKKNNYILAVCFILLSSLFFTLNKSISYGLSSNVGVFQKTFYAGLVGTVIFGVIILIKKESFFGKKPSLLFIRGLFGFLSTLCMIVANTYTKRPLFELDVVSSTSAIFTCIVAVIFLKERLNKKQVLAIFLCFTGVYITVNPSAELFTDFYIIFAFLGAILAGSAYVCVRGLKIYASTNTVVFGFSFYTMILSLPFFLIYEVGINKEPLQSGNNLLLLLLMGLALAMGQLFLNFGYRLADASKISVFAYSQMIYSLLITTLFFNSKIEIMSIIGSVFVLLSGILMAYINYKITCENIIKRKELTDS